METGYRKRACDRCHHLKHVCSGDIPCLACVKSKNACTFYRPTTKMGRPRVNSSKQKDEKSEIKATTKRTKYSHNGCFECKNKKKRCDEDWPVCGRCKRLNIECEKTQQASSAKTNRNVDSKQMTDIEPKESTNPPPNQTLNPMGVPSPDAYFTESKIDEINLFFEDLAPLTSVESSIINRKEKMLLNSLMKTDVGMLNNMESRKQSSKHTGYYVAELQNTIVPAKTPLNGASPNSSESSDGSSHYEITKSELSSKCLTSVQLPRKEQELLLYFITDVSPLLFVDKTTTRFLSTIIPLCIDETKVRYPIVSIAASHKANSYGPQNLEASRDKAVFAAMADTIYIRNYSMPKSFNEVFLLSILLIAVRDVLEGTSVTWSLILEEAAEYIHNNGGLKTISGQSPLAIQLFFYLDLISSLSTCSSPFVELGSPITTQIEDVQKANLFSSLEGDYVEELLNSKFGFKFGTGGEIFKIIGNISTLASLRENRYRSEKHARKFNSLANLIEMRLQKWTLPLDSLTRQKGLSSNDYSMNLSSYTLALQWAAFLRLHQVRFGYNRKDTRVEACLAMILSNLKSINNIDLETGLMFPLIMAGSVAYNDVDRDYIIARIARIKNHLKFTYISEFERLLRFIWSRDDSEGDSVNWAKIRYYQFPGLVMF